MFSSLQLADGLLYVHDLDRLQQTPHTVVLTACSAARAGVYGGDELLGTSVALLALGVRSVVAPLLPVRDDSAMTLAVELHRQLRDLRRRADGRGRRGARHRRRRRSRPARCGHVDVVHQPTDPLTDPVSSRRPAASVAHDGPDQRTGSPTMTSPRLACVAPGCDAAIPLPELAARAIEHDQQAWRALVDRLKGVAWKVLYGYDLSEEDRKDAFASTFFRLYEHLGNIRELEKLPGWVATTARNEAHTIFRRRRNTVPMESVDLRETPVTEETDHVVAGELHVALHAAFAPSHPAVAGPDAAADDRPAAQLRRDQPHPRHPSRLDRTAASALPGTVAQQPRAGPLLRRRKQVLMNARHDLHDDDELVGLLGAALAHYEVVPDDALAAAYAAVDLDSLHEELADLVFDSADESALAAMRAVDVETRLLSFVNDHLTLDVELHADGLTIVGQLTPAGDQSLDVERFDGSSVPAEVDEFGRFRVNVPHGPIRLRVVGRLVTPWITR